MQSGAESRNTVSPPHRCCRFKFSLALGQHCDDLDCKPTVSNQEKEELKGGEGPIYIGPRGQGTKGPMAHPRVYQPGVKHEHDPFNIWRVPAIPRAFWEPFLNTSTSRTIHGLESFAHHTYTHTHALNNLTTETKQTLSARNMLV
jgi:hypothetical protein